MISIALEKLHNTLNFKNILLAVGFLALVFIVFYYNSKEINQKMAYGGRSPQHYVAQKLHPENFKADWSNGILRYDHSLPMRAYYYLAKYCGISPSVTIYPFMFFHTLLFFLSVAFVTQTLFQNKFVTFLSVVIIAVSYLAGLNLSRFSRGYGMYLKYSVFYAYANAFRLFALGFFLRNKYIPCSVFLALSVYCHVTMGLFAVAFIGAYLVFKPLLFRDKSVLIGILAFLTLVTPHIYSIISNSSMLSGGIPVDLWVQSMRWFSSHWFPITMKMFTSQSHRDFFPFLLVCFFFFVALKYQDIEDEKNLKIIVGSIACLIMAMFGVVFSDVYPIPFFVRMSLQRSTGLLTFFGVLYIIYYNFQKINAGNIISVFLATFSLLVLAFSKPGIAVLPLFLLLFGDIREGYFGPIKMSSDKIKIAKYCYYIIALLLLLVALPPDVFQGKFKIAHSALVHLWRPLEFFNPFCTYDFLLRGGAFKINPFYTRLIVCALLCASIIIIFRFAGNRNRVLNTLFVGIFAIGTLSGVWYLDRDRFLKRHRNIRVKQSYLDAQLWTNKNTPIDSLFMTNPAHWYGWRDFSERSGFGNIREWGYCAINYSPDYKLYQEGLKRMRAFGFDVTEDNPTILMKSYRKFLKTFLNMTPEQFRELSRIYKIDYLVMRKSYDKKRVDAFLDAFTVVYQNTHYIIYKF